MNRTVFAGRSVSKLFASQLVRQLLRSQTVMSTSATVKQGKRGNAMELPPGALVGFGNPLLDINVKVEDNLLLEKYGLNPNEAIVAEEKHMALFEELSQMEDVKYSAGGACQNSVRVFQWIIGEPQRATYFGAIGNDKFGEIIGKRARAYGVETRYQIKEDQTGTCAVIINGPNRSLIANLGAARLFEDELLDDEETQCVLERAKMFYITGFFLAVCPPTVMRIGKLASETKRTFMFNLSATFVMLTMKDVVHDVLPYVDILVGNKEEALALAAAQEWDTKDLFEIGRRVQCSPKESLRPRLVIFTDNTCPILLFSDEGCVKEYPVPKLDKKKVVDSNGCGDAFVGCFISQYIQRMPIDYCIRAGIWAAQQVIQVVGVSLDNLAKFEDSCI